MKFHSSALSLHKHIESLAKKQPTRTALLSCTKEGRAQKTYTYKELKGEIEKIASWLQYELNLESGDVLGLMMPNSAELLMISWAAWASGIVTVPLDVKRDTLKNYVYKIKLTQAKVVLATEGVINGKDRKQLTKAAEVVIVKQPLKLAEAKTPLSWAKDISHTALFLFTSGTTAAPKGVELTLENLVANGESIREWFEIKKTDRFLALLPLYHINSTTFSLSVLLAGGGIAIPPLYSNSHFWQQLAETKSTFTSIVPTICYDQLSRTKEFEKVKKKLKVNRIQIGSAPVVVQDVKEFIEQFHIKLFQGYGQTETALRATGTPLNCNKKLYEKLTEENSIGKAIKWAEVAVVDKKGKPLPARKEGEIAIKGPVVMKGYLRNPRANKSVFKKGYFLSGDIGYYKKIQGTPYFFLKGRSKEIIIKGGINLSPVSIESKLKLLNKNIDQVYVIGVPDRRYGEEVAAIICWKPGKRQQLEGKLKNTLASTSSDIMPIEVPKYLTSIDARDLPVTSTGKIQRSQLKDTIPIQKLQHTDVIAENKAFRFVRLIPDNKVHMKGALALYNRNWSPLTIDEKTLQKQAANGIIILAVDTNEKIEGMLTILRTSLPESKLKKTTYQALTGDQTLDTNEKDGTKFVCVSICSSNYRKPHKNPITVEAPSIREMTAYLRSGHDLVFNFHQKPKGGLKKGARLVKVLPNSRSDDARALRYNLLLKYPKLPARKVIVPNESASVASQLIEAAMTLGQQLGVREVYAYSRPAGAAEYFGKMQKT